MQRVLYLTEVMMAIKQQPEPWLRGTRTEIDAVPRAILHALDLAWEDVEVWCGELSDAELNARPYDLAPVAFHIRHMARTLDRILTYAEGQQLDATQITLLKTELDPGATHGAIFTELRAALDLSAKRILAFPPSQMNDERGVGKKMLPTNVGGLLVHCADHTQRHVGQAVITAKVVMAGR
jgi:hypothetical protein